MRYLNNLDYIEQPSQRGAVSNRVVLLDDPQVSEELTTWIRARIGQEPAFRCQDAVDFANSNPRVLKLVELHTDSIPRISNAQFGSDYVSENDSDYSESDSEGNSDDEDSATDESISASEDECLSFSADIPAQSLVCKLPVTNRMMLLWMSKHGLIFDKSKAKYVDGHDRPDVVEYRRLYLERKARYDKYIIYRMPGPAEIEQFEKLPLLEKPIIYISQDESTYYCNDRIRTNWKFAASNSSKCKAKSAGHSIMVSGFFDPVSGGCIRHNNDVGYSYFEAGKGNWWTSEKMCAQMTEVTSL